eukprot:11584417-Karenia_brevis.AAC.1
MTTATKVNSESRGLAVCKICRHERKAETDTGPMPSCRLSNEEAIPTYLLIILAGARAVATPMLLWQSRAQRA